MKLQRRTTSILFSAMTGLILMGTGCQRTQPSYPGAVNVTPIPVDAAMATRTWPAVPVQYANETTVAGPTGFWFEPKSNLQQQTYGFLETPIFFVNMVTLPVALASQPVWTKQNYAGEVVEPTYTGQPPLPYGPIPIPAGVRDTGSAGGANGTGAQAGGATPGTGSQTGVPSNQINQSGTATPGPGGSGTAQPTAVSPGTQSPGTISPGVTGSTQVPQPGTPTPTAGGTGPNATGGSGTGAGTGTGTGTGTAGATSGGPGSSTSTGPTTKPGMVKPGLQPPTTPPTTRRVEIRR